MFRSQWEKTTTTTHIMNSKKTSSAVGILLLTFVVLADSWVAVIWPDSAALTADAQLIILSIFISVGYIGGCIEELKSDDDG